MRARSSFLALCFSLVAALPAYAALTITSVQPSRSHVASGEAVTIRFRLEEPARVTLNLYDGRDVLIRHVVSAGELKAGDNALTWDGKDEAGRPVPAEAYTYTLLAARDAQAVTWDIADTTSGQDIVPRSVSSDPQSGKIRFVLDAPARVSIRVGFQDNGPLLRTVLDWAPRPGGPNEESWDGWDTSRVLALVNHPKRDIVVSAFKLPENSILVGTPTGEVTLIDSSGWPRVTRVSKGSTVPKRMYAHGQQSLESRSDFGVELVLPADLKRDGDGVPIVTGPIPVRLRVPAEDQSRAVARRFEPVFFLDGQFVFENEVGFVPMTWNWDPKGVNPGVHYLTVNLRGYEGNFGMATVKVVLQQEGRR
jgi:hypothetical protein